MDGPVFVLQSSVGVHPCVCHCWRRNMFTKEHVKAVDNGERYKSGQLSDDSKHMNACGFSFTLPGCARRCRSLLFSHKIQCHCPWN